MLAFFYLLAIFAEFMAPYEVKTRFEDMEYHPLTRVRFFENGMKRPFVYATKQERDSYTLEKVFALDESVRYPIRFFHRGDAYRFWGLWETNVHLIGVDEPGLLRKV